MILAYADPTPRWVPFVLVALVTIAGWWGAFSPVGASLRTATLVAVGLGGVLLFLVFLQGWLYWTGQVESLAVGGGRAEIVTMRWVGRGKRISFAPGETSDWKAIAKQGDAGKLAGISFTIRGQTLDLSFLSPQVANVDLLATLAPDFFAKLRHDYPTIAARS